MLPSTYPSITYSRRQFLRKKWPIQLAFFLLLFVVRRMSFRPWLFLIILHFSYEQSKWYTSFPSTALTQKKTYYIAYLLFNVPKDQHHIKLYSKWRSLLVAFLNLCPNCWWKDFFCWTLLWGHSNPGLNFTCTSFIDCYHATEIDEIFYILQLPMIHHNVCWR